MDFHLEELEKIRSMLHNKIAEKDDQLLDPQVLALSQVLDEYMNEHFFQKNDVKQQKKK